MFPQILWLLNKCINRSLATSCILGLSLTTTQVAQAEYHPPPDQRPVSGYTWTTGTRGGGGCGVSQGPSLTVLAPLQHIGQTASLHPTFAWFVPSNSSSLPLEFTLFELDSNGQPKLAQKLKRISSPGIMKLSLSEDKPGLTVGQRYLWQIVISCDPNHPSTDLVTRAEIQVVEMPRALKKPLSVTREPLKRVDLYAESGLWYDALSEALGSTSDGRLGEYASTLLEDLAKLEEPKQSANLRQIALQRRTDARRSQ